MATGELYKAIEILETMRTVYPRSAPVHNTLATRYVVAGELEKAVESFREAIRLTRHPNAYAGLVGVYSQLERLQEAKDLIAEARVQGIDNRNIRVILYQIGFLQGNRPAMIEQVEWASGKPDEAFMLLQQANAAAAAGQLQQARGFFRQAIETARRRGLNDAAAEFAAAAGMWEAFLGNCREAKSCADEALAGYRGWRILYPAAITLATCGDVQQAEALAEEIASRYPTDTVIQSVILPIARGFIELARGSSVQVLSLVGPPRAKILMPSLWPAYLSGEAYLRQGAVPEARGEFQQILDRRPVALLSPIYALAKLGFARAMAASGDTIKGRKAYQDFFTVWGNADQNLPVFRRAVAEYAGLK
jgi:tetratricopeptide (TPR) repeat protein